MIFEECLCPMSQPVQVAYTICLANYYSVPKLQHIMHQESGGGSFPFVSSAHSSVGRHVLSGDNDLRHCPVVSMTTLWLLLLHGASLCLLV